ncbi:Histidinol-phosphatase [Tritonibacter multivorans]|uniref:Histidinol-phosphatase n=1 Tax=Tritonibacter multivorans TaxID=928856 RepID=A0A0P1G6L9_9RHOB|nr:inositol monophosphatase family protein [Tritonibacter multivorans]MDA7422672.1 histidinol phosphate phosphatase [Tritonibacter multivorans]CUH77203.1 Histidinol-phosphatase [Tritonibacter multivorans]SFD52347.1 histidinol-phosphatase, inositol monophosphatase family [Tritonibacter multivorans]
MFQIDTAAEVLLRLCDAARPIVRDHWLSPKQVDYKSDGSLLTQADLAVERLLRDGLRAAFPDHGLLGEEYGADAAERDYTWVIDPIDGTRPYGFGLPNFASLAALCHHGRPILGMIDLPLLDVRYIGIAGQGTWLNGRKLQVSATKQLSQAHGMLANHDSFTDGTDAAYDALRARLRATAFDGGSPAYGALAAGKIDLCLNGPDLNAHDICALVPVVEGAGGVVTSWQGEPLTLASSGAIVASATAQLHDAALTEIAGAMTP